MVYKLFKNSDNILTQPLESAAIETASCIVKLTKFESLESALGKLFIDLGLAVYRYKYLVIFVTWCYS